jgi:hypothetical protein
LPGLWSKLGIVLLIHVFAIALPLSYNGPQTSFDLNYADFAAQNLFDQFGKNENIFFYLKIAQFNFFFSKLLF